MSEVHLYPCKGQVYTENKRNSRICTQKYKKIIVFLEDWNNNTTKNTYLDN